MTARRSKMTTDTMPALLSLPRELRDEIHVHVFGEHSTMVQYKSHPRKGNSATEIPGLLGVCRQIYGEATGVYYHHTSLEFHDNWAMTARHWIESIPINRLKKVGSLFVDTKLVLMETRKGITIAESDKIGRTLARNIVHLLGQKLPDAPVGMLRFSGAVVNDGNREAWVDESVLIYRPKGRCYQGRYSKSLLGNQSTDWQ